MEKQHHYPSLIYAGFWIRVLAYGLDLIMIGSLQRMLLFFLDNGSIKTMIGLVIYLLYFVLMTKLNHGQTLGKMVFGLRVISFNEKNLSWSTVIVRELFGRYLQKTFLIMYLLIVFTPQKQHIIDLLVDTSVISQNNLLLYLEQPMRRRENLWGEEKTI